MTDIETQLEQLTGGLREVVRQQQESDPAHEDLYLWGWALSELTQRTEDAGRVLARQVSKYGNRRILRDDQEGADPATRLMEATAHLNFMATALAEANAAARAYHSAIGHIGVAVDPDARS